MAELRRIPLPQLLRRVLDEPARQGTLFDLPLRKCWRPDPRADLSVDVHGRRVQSPVGPAAGPHAQLAQNIVLAWLGGSRIVELKTVQILDQLKIPRPCIDAATVGFNVEWSQELPLAESVREYVAGWMLVAMLQHLDPLGLGETVAAAAAPVFELSVGYDLAGLSTPAMRAYLAQVKNVSALVDELRAEIPIEERALRDLPYRAEMVTCVTLSTFHGCPPREVEAIVRYLLDEHDVDVIVKLNPTLLGYDEVCHLLHERMGYHALRPKKSAFEGDLHWDEAVDMATRLDAAAKKKGRHFGVKMTNTLVVENHKSYFGAEEMYLSGPPLHVLALSCADRFRAALGDGIPLSFSGGIDAHNATDAIACDLVPVTTCTDLLRAGGYGRLPKYLENTEAAMRELGAPDRGELILKRFARGEAAVRLVCAALGEESEALARLSSQRRERGEQLLGELEADLVAATRTHGATVAATIGAFRERLSGLNEGAAELATVLDAIVGGLGERIVRQAGVLNGHEMAARALGDPRYAAGKNAKPPRKVGSHLQLFDCLSCDKCVPVCPNDANFEIATALEEVAFEDLVLDENGGISRTPGAQPFRVVKPRQWANYADACNECGNCDVFCPEDGGPYVMKTRFFGSRASFAESPSLDGLFIDEEIGGFHVLARVEGRALELRVEDSGACVLDDGRLRASYDARSGAVLGCEGRSGGGRPAAGATHRLPGTAFLTLRAIVRGVLDPFRVNPVTARLPRLRWPS